MNQSILFPDIQSWDEDKQAVLFSAQQAGALIQCLVSKTELEKLSGQTVENERQALEVFSQYRFDLEELAEELIEDEEFNSQGWIEVVS
ncbi:DUF1488 domain-containing protein [Vibrio tubiashii]|uniref:DUF1488 domain-containing protein n=1 Tax=Vibrio tubiashii TaxID=29498 RepID=UPI001EFE5826|nr:DUF1488 domain-containing protein [Vibrio tubiashii]MCG9575935.1 DUF1488 domain-containing protein [Vibrio tubiashii]